MSEKNLAGRVKNTGSQVVKAPYSGNGGSKGNVVHKGTDLRTGKKK